MRHIKRFSFLVALSLGFASASAFAATGGADSVGEADALRLAVRLTDASSRMTAIGLRSLVEAERPDLRIETTWIRGEDEALDRLEAEDAELALLTLDQAGLERLADRPELRAVMRYRTLEAVDDDRSAPRPEQLLVAGIALSPARVETLLEIALQDHVVLQAARIDVTKLTPEDALTGLPIAAHDGVDSYLRRVGVVPAAAPAAPSEASPAAATTPAVTTGQTGGDGGAEPAPTPGYTRAEILAARSEVPAEVRSGRSFTLYFDTADATVDRSGYRSVAEACNYAASLSRARFVISGHADTVGTTAYNQDLSNRRATAVADAIRNDPRFREALSVVEFGERRLAVATADGVPEPRNRRVEITIYEE